MKQPTRPRHVLILIAIGLVASSVEARAQRTWTPIQAGKLRGTNYIPNTAEAQCDVFFFLTKGTDPAAWTCRAPRALTSIP